MDDKDADESVEMPSGCDEELSEIDDHIDTDTLSM
jgi:hypothetical protein